MEEETRTFSLNPRLVGQVFRQFVNPSTVAHEFCLNPRLVGQVFRHLNKHILCGNNLGLNPRLVGQVFRRNEMVDTAEGGNVLIPD